MLPPGAVEHGVRLELLYLRPPLMAGYTVFPLQVLAHNLCLFWTRVEKSIHNGRRVSCRTETPSCTGVLPAISKILAFIYRHSMSR